MKLTANAPENGWFPIGISFSRGPLFSGAMLVLGSICVCISYRWCYFLWTFFHVSLWLNLARIVGFSHHNQAILGFHRFQHSDTLTSESEDHPRKITLALARNDFIHPDSGISQPKKGD